MTRRTEPPPAVGDTVRIDGIHTLWTVLEFDTFADGHTYALLAAVTGRGRTSVTPDRLTIVTRAGETS